MRGGVLCPDSRVPWQFPGGGVSPSGATLFKAQGLVALTGLRTLGFEWVAPLGLRKCGHGRTQALVALIGLRTLGFEGVAPLGLRKCGHGLTQGLVALAGLRTLGFGAGSPL